MPTLGVEINSCIQAALDRRVFPSAQIAICWRGQEVFCRAYGRSDSHQTTLRSRFDLASVTKPFTATAFLRAVEQGAVGLDQPVHTVLPEFTGSRPIQPYEDPLRPGHWLEIPAGSGQVVEAGEVTFRQLLTHTSGLPGWRPLWQQPDLLSAQRLALETFFAYPTGAQILYSDIGYILLGLALERLQQKSLDRILQEWVLDPLGLTETSYGPIDPELAVPTEFCEWRGGRVQGEVHDDNAARLNGIAGHAGLFATGPDLARFGQRFLAGGGLKPETVHEMIRTQAQHGSVRRGLGFALHHPDPTVSSFPLSPSAFGHTGFTGTSLWMDPDRQLVIAFLTNSVYYGRDHAGILPFRGRLHQTIVTAIDNCSEPQKCSDL